jgi:hypothetical protein
VANNVCSAVEYFRKLGGNVGVAGMVINKDDGTGEAQAFAEQCRRHPGAGRDPGQRRHPPQERQLRNHRPPRHAVGPLFEELATNVAEAPPVRPTPLTQDQLLGLFSADIGRPRRGAGARDAVRHVRQARDRQAHARSRLRRGLTMDHEPHPHPHHPARRAPVPRPGEGDGMGCHSGKDAMLAAAQGRRQVRDAGAVRADYGPEAGPHDQPQSMCPAFGSLRVGLRMRRTATILSGSACCVYGLTFTSHFYGARRSVGYVPFNSESLVTGKLFEDIREAVHAQADPALYDAIVIINLCVPTASGVPLQTPAQEINGVRIIGIDVPGFGVPTHAEAKDVLAGAMLKYARAEAEAGPVQAPRAGRAVATSPRSRCWARCSRPTR